MIVVLQNIIAKCQRSLHKYEYVGGPGIAALWKDALDGASRQERREVQSDMLRAALGNEFWDLAQQVSLISSTFCSILVCIIPFVLHFSEMSHSVTKCHIPYRRSKSLLNILN
jgi:hypothetical protein